MKRLQTVMLLLALTGMAETALGDDSYYPYQFYDDYYRQQEEPAPLPAPKPGGTPRTAPGVQKRAPLFLFPKELGFGVAAGVTDDLFLVAGTYYRASGGAWYRSDSWRGPWLGVPRGKLPQEFVKRTLPQMRAVRDREFRRFWQEKGNYGGQLFRPDAEEEKPAAMRPN